MYFLFCCTFGAAFFASFTVCENIYKAVCVSSILWSTFVFVLVEGLNFFKAITAANLMIVWGIFLIVIGGYCVSKRALLKNKIALLKRSVVSLYRNNRTSVKALIIFITFFMVARTILAVITASHDADSMTYHLSRIMYWIQHKSVDYYDTHVMRQLFSPVFAEYINLNVFLLTGGDLFVNMLQNFSAYGCLLLLYGIIKNLGCGIKWALFGCVLALSMNIFVAESLSTQVDMVGAFYLVTLTYLIIEVLYKMRLTIFQFTLLGLASGLIYITKTNACAPAAVIIFYVVLVKIFQGNFKIIPLGIVSLIFIGLIVSTTFYRNYNEFNGDFMARINVGNIAIGTAKPVYILVNVIKNLITIGAERNQFLLRGFLKTFGRVFNIDINAPETTFAALPFDQKYLYYFPGLGSGGGAHLVTPLFLIATMISLAYLVKRRTKTEGFMFALILQMFSILVILRWQPWASRLILPSLVVVVIPIVYYFREITNSFDKSSLKYKICYFLILELIFQCGICSAEGLGLYSYIALHSLRYPRYSRYFGFGQHSKKYAAYTNFSRMLDEGNYSNIGFDGTEGMYQYPLLAKCVPQGKKVECVSLQGNGRETKILNPNFEPDIIFAQDVELSHEKIYTCNGNNYKCVFNLIDDNPENSQINYYSVWVKK